MNQAGRGPLQQPQGVATNNIYTALTAMALLALIVGIGYVWIRGSDMFGTGNPFTVVAEPVMTLPMLPWSLTIG